MCQIIYTLLLCTLVGMCFPGLSTANPNGPDHPAEVNNRLAAPATIAANYYQQLGIPGIKQTWAPLDYLTAANIFASLVKQTPQNLPHYSNTVARPYMQHIVDGKNFYTTLRFANTHQQRIALITLYLDALQRLFTVYQYALSQDCPYSAEWVDIIGLSSYLAALSQPEWDFYLQQSTMERSPALHNSALDEKIQAVTLLQTALVNPVIIGLQTLPKLPVLSAWRLLQHLNYSLPTYMNSLPLSAQEPLQQAFMLAHQHSKDPHLRTAIKQLMSR